MSQDDLFAISFEGMLPVTYTGSQSASGVAPGTFSTLTKDIEWGDTQKYFAVNASGIVLAQAERDGSPIIVLSSYGQGSVLYYGLNDATSTFAQEPYYPVFWKRILDAMGGRLALDRLNVQTGDAATVSAAPKKTPTSEMWGSFYDWQGYYEYSDRTVSANLASREESQVNTKPFSRATASASSLASVQDTKEKELTSIVVFAALVLIFLELFIVKYRGDF